MFQKIQLAFFFEIYFLTNFKCTPDGFFDDRNFFLAIVIDDKILLSLCRSGLGAGFINKAEKTMFLKYNEDPVVRKLKQFIIKNSYRAFIIKIYIQVAKIFLIFL